MIIPQDRLRFCPIRSSRSPADGDRFPASSCPAAKIPVRAAREELVAAGIEIVADTVWAAEAFDDPGLEGFGWLFFRAPDGNIYAMEQDHAASTPTDRSIA